MRLVKRALESNDFSLPEPTYRLRIDTQSVPSDVLGGAPVKAAAVDQKVRASSESAQPNDTAVDRELEKRVEEERVATAEEDLLSDDAPQRIRQALRSCGLVSRPALQKDADQFGLPCHAGLLEDARQMCAGRVDRDAAAGSRGAASIADKHFDRQCRLRRCQPRTGADSLPRAATERRCRSRNTSFARAFLP